MPSAKKYQINDQFTLKIERLGINGEGVGKIDGYTIFVDFALPGETVLVKLTDCRKSFAFAILLEILTPSPDRISPICPIFGKCGGCQVMHLSYEKQLEMKERRILDAFDRIGKLPNIPLERITPSPSPLHYRNKIQLPFSQEKTFGLYAKNSHAIVPVDTCYIHTPLGEQIFQTIKRLFKKHSIPLDHLLLKTAVKKGEVLVIFIGGEKDLLLPLALEICASHTEVKGIVHATKGKGNRVLGEEFTTLCGQNSMIDELCGLEFKVSPASFFQVNPLQAENLYQKALSLANLTGQETVLDAYCGVGTLSLLFAKKAKKVIGIECIKAATEDAKENALLNGITNVEFVCDLAENYIQHLKQIDVAILNPPRKGCDLAFLENLCQLSPSQILYISCDPATLARDLSLLKERGYNIQKAYPFDMFPQTSHVECIAHLTILK